jgi:hypothetical protein
VLPDDLDAGLQGIGFPTNFNAADLAAKVVDLPDRFLIRLHEQAWDPIHHFAIVPALWFLGTAQSGSANYL